MRSGNKSDLVHILEALINPVEVPKFCDGIVYDGAALVHTISSRHSKTYDEYFELELKPHVSSLYAERIDFVWDLYSDKSVKLSVREGRGLGIRRQISEKSCSSSNSNTYLSNASCTDMEEADGRIVLYARDMATHGARCIVIRSSDTDVLILAVSFFHSLKALGLSQLWLFFGSGNKQRFISVHGISESLGQEKSAALRGFHAFTGCDTVSYFNGKGKRSTWKTWNSLPNATSAFRDISIPQQVISEQIFCTLQNLSCTTNIPNA
ncbi:hypothetical protein FQR65_LT14432 [Abscondita terminalis]|nr:hypothetical protein FQR65_LT14432 [Abscondita terminalis]